MPDLPIIVTPETDGHDLLKPPVSYLTPKEQLKKFIMATQVPNAPASYLEFRLDATLTSSKAYVQSMRVALSRLRGQLVDEQRPVKRFKIYARFTHDPKTRTTVVLLESTRSNQGRNHTRRSGQERDEMLNVLSGETP